MPIARDALLPFSVSLFVCDVLQGLGGADANGVDSRLVSHLHVAALFNRPDVARLLLMCGASPDIVGGVTRAAAVKGGQLWSPLEMAEEACVEGGELDEGKRMFCSCRGLVFHCWIIFAVSELLHTGFCLAYCVWLDSVLENWWYDNDLW